MTNHPTMTNHEAPDTETEAPSIGTHHRIADANNPGVTTRSNEPAYEGAFGTVRCGGNR